jgi:spore coat protein U-like protein
MKKVLLAAAAVAAFAGLSAPAFAVPLATIQENAEGTCVNGSPCEDSDLDVRVTIVEDCASIEVGDIDFGTRFVDTEDLLGETTLEVKCNTGVPYTVELDYGLNEAGTLGNGDAFQRQVANNDDGTFIDYELFSDAARTNKWGQAADPEAVPVTGTGNGDFQPLPVYGTLRQLDTKLPGVYTDLVTATLIY